MRSTMHEFRLDLDKTFDVARHKLSRTEAFPALRDGMAGMGQSPSEMQKEDPLATQVWRFFSKTKLMLPNQERMENITWRMMHLNLRKRLHEEQELEQAR